MISRDSWKILWKELVQKLLVFTRSFQFPSVQKSLEIIIFSKKKKKKKKKKNKRKKKKKKEKINHTKKYP